MRLRSFAVVILVVAGCNRPVPPAPTAVPSVRTSTPTAAPPPAPDRVGPLLERVSAALASPPGVDWASLEKELTDQIMGGEPRADLRSARGAVRMHLGRDLDARDDFARAVELAPLDLSIRRRRVPLLQKVGPAIVLAEDVGLLLQQNPDNLELLAIRAQLAETDENLAVAIDDLGRLIEADPENRELRLRRATLAARTGSRELAVADVTHVLLKEPSADLYALRAEINLHTVWLSPVEADCRRALELDPKHPQALKLLCLLLHRVRRFDEVPDVANQLVALDESNPEYRFIRGEGYAFVGKTDQARPDLEFAWTRDESFKPRGVDLLTIPLEQLLSQRGDKKC